MFAEIIKILNIVITFEVIIRGVSVQAQSCSPSYGINIPSSAAQAGDSELGTAVLLTDAKYTFDCCGFVAYWEYKSTVAGPFEAQVWRHDTGDNYNLIGYHSITAAGTNNVEQSPVFSTRIRVQDGDHIGLHSQGTFVVGRKSGNINLRRVTSYTSSMPDPTTFSVATGSENEYLIIAYINENQTPIIGTLNPVTVWNDEFLSGETLATITVSDPDIEDLGQLNVTMDYSAYFVIDSGSMVHLDDPTINRCLYGVLCNFGIQYKDGTSSFFLSTERPKEEMTAFSNVNSNNITGVTVPPVGQYDLGITVQDPCLKSATSTQIIHVQNRLPEIHDFTTSISILEDTPTNELLFTFIANDTVTFPLNCLITTGDSTAFTVQHVAGTTEYELYTNTPGVTFNYDVTPSYSLTVSCNDSDNTVAATVTIGIIPNQPPVIHNLDNSTSISEDENTKILLYKFNVTDNEGDTVTCTLLTNNATFEMDLVNSVDYGAYLQAGITLDHDTRSSYVLTIYCSDHRRGVSADLTVNLIRNQPPVIENLDNTIKLSEDATVKTLLYMLNVTDNEADTIICTLLTENATFQVELVGADYGAFLKGGLFLNYDVVPSYVLTIYCADHRRGVSADLTVNLIRNEPPTIVNLVASIEIPETTSTESLLYTVSVTDPTNDTVTCTITSSVVSFYITATGNAFEKSVMVRSGQSFDYDTQREYPIDITCADQRRNDSSTLNVYLSRNMPPSFTNLQGKANISSQASSSSVLFTVLETDPENDAIKFYMSADDPNAPFTIDQNTGEIKLSRSISTESVVGYELYINISDGRNTVGPRGLSVTINDINFPPSFSNLPLNISVLEEANTGATIFTPEISDQDGTSSYQFFTTFNPPEGSLYFDVNSTTGIVTQKIDLDYESLSSKSFQLEMTVSDSAMTDTANLFIDIRNVNERPEFSKVYYSLAAAENVAGTVLQDPGYQYVDPDGDTVTFLLNCGDNTGLFYIDSSTGLLDFAVDYDADNAGFPEIVICNISISDGELTDTCSINITIEANNDNTPYFYSPEYTFIVSSDISLGTIVGQLQAHDDDKGTFGELLFHIAQEGLYSDLFSVGTDGSLSLQQSLSGFTEGTTLNFTVYVVDNGGLENSTLVHIIIRSNLVYTTVQNPIVYVTFFSAPENMPWVVTLGFILFITACVVINTIYEGHCSFNCPKTPKCLQKKPKTLPRRRRNKPFRH